jgi:hypothetical protein
MKRLLLPAFSILVAGCHHIETIDPIRPTPVRFRVTQRSIDEIRDTLPSWLVPEGGSYIAFEAESSATAPQTERAEHLRLLIESSVTGLEPGEECSVKVALLGGAPGASYRVTLVVPDELSIRGPAIFVMESGESRAITVVSHARTTAKILARVQRISERVR